MPSGLTIWRIVVVLMAVWLIVLLLMSSSLYQSASNTDESVERQLFDAMKNLNSLRMENQALKKEAEELRWGCLLWSGSLLVLFIVLLRLSKPVPKLQFFAKPNRTETAVLYLCIDGSVLKWSSSGVLNVTVGCRLQVVSPTRLAGGCYRWDQRRDRRRRRPCTPRRWRLTN